MSEPFLRLPHGSAMALVSLERSHPGIAARFIERWLMCVISRPPVSLEAALDPDDMVALEAVGLAQNGSILLISVAVANISKHRESGKLGGAKSAQVRAKRQPATNQTPTKPEPNSNQTATRKEKGERRREKEEGFSSVGSFGADAPTEPPSPPVEHENASPGVVALISMRELSDAMCEDFAQSRSGKYLWSRVDGVQLARLRKTATDAEIRERWRRGLTAHGWQQVSTVAQLAAKWNDLAPSGLAGRGEIRAVEGSL